MRSDRQGSVLTPKAPPSSFDSRKRAAPVDQHRHRVDKKPRLDASYGGHDKENVRSSNVGGAGKDEQRMMDDLMAGLDASMFDGLDSSPAATASQKKSRLSQRSPLKARSHVKSELLSPMRSSGRPIAPLPLSLKVENVQKAESNNVKRLTPALKPVKTEPPSNKAEYLKPKIPMHNSPIINTKVQERSTADIKPAKAELPGLDDIPDIKPAIQINDKQDIQVRVEDTKPDLDDEDEFSFDFDLGDLADMDDDLLLKAHVAAEVRHPH